MTSSPLLVLPFFFQAPSHLLELDIDLRLTDLWREALGIEEWSIEVVSAILLLVPSLAFFGALLLVPTMVGAVLTHLFIVGGNPTPAFVLGVAVLAPHRLSAARMYALEERWLPVPRPIHPYPEQRFAASHPR